MKNTVKGLVVVAMLFLAFSAQAQIFGVKGGLGLANLTSPTQSVSDGFGRTFGAKIGGTIEFDIIDNLYIGSGLGFSKRGASTNRDNVNLYYIDLPATARYDILEVGGSGYLYATGGFNLGFLMSAKEGGEKLNIGSKSGDYVKGLDFGLNTGVGVIFDERFEVGLLTEFGLVNILNSNNATLRNAQILISFGYKFGM